MTPRTKRVLSIAGAAVLVGAIFAWSEHLFSDRVGPGDGPTAALEPYRGATALAERRDVPLRSEASCTVRPSREATIAARVLATVSDVLVKDGDRVAAGAVVVRLSAPELASRSEASRSAVAAAEARRAQAERDVARMEALARREAATQVELERARTALSVAEADLSRERRSSAADADLASRVVLTAPMTGVVLKRLADPGDQAAPGVPLLIIGDDASLRLECSVDERDAAGFEIGRSVEARVDALGLRAPARVVEIVPSADPASRTLLVKAELAPDPRLRSGLSGRIAFEQGRREAVVVPEAALRRTGALWSVRVIGADGVARMRAVRVASEPEDGVAEILAGLEGGETLASEASP